MTSVTLPPVTLDEYNHLIRLLGAASGDIGPRSLGQGLTGDGVIALRKKLEKLTAEITPDQAMIEIANGTCDRVVVPGKWRAYLHDGHPVVEYFDLA